MDSEGEVYGAGLPLFDALRLLAQYGPLLGRLQAVAGADDAYGRAVAIVDALKWAAAKSDGTTLDDEAVEHLHAILKSPEGKAFFGWLAKLVGGAL